MPRRLKPTLVLVHGLAIVHRAHRMLPGVADALTGRGHRVVRTIVQGDGSLRVNADRLWSQLDAVDGPVALLCHSTGGLQARTLLLDDRRASRITAIVTLGTPHQGLATARWMIPFHRAYRDLTPEARAGWINRHGAEEHASIARHGIRAASVVARLTGPARHPSLLVGQAIMGPGDGLVPAESQEWGTKAFEVDLDHAECAGLRVTSGRRLRYIETWERMAQVALMET